MHVKHSFTGEQVKENEKLCSDFDFLTQTKKKTEEIQQREVGIV